MIDETDRHHDDAPPRDELDALLAEWHDSSAAHARAARQRVMQAVSAAAASRGPAAGAAPRTSRPRLTLLPHSIRSPSFRAAASFLVVVVLVALLRPMLERPATAGEIMVPEAGRLEALDEHGRELGPCPLEHTDVDVDVSGRFARVTLRQRFHNPYSKKIEAVYTFPLSHRAAVDRMVMRVGDRVIVGEVKERGEARRLYESARAQGYVASLLEQERPNIFTQSIANIEPDATVTVEIAYLELVKVVDGVHHFDFPMVVAPRYIPGTPTASRALVPAELTPRHGVILRGPAHLTLGQPGDTDAHGALTAGRLQTILAGAQPIDPPGGAWWGAGPDAQVPPVWQAFEAAYTDGSREIGWLHVDGTGQVNGRWFFADPAVAADHGAGFAANTDAVPDASRITPMPVRPPKRAGHTISLTMTLDTGGPDLVAIDSELHEVDVRDRTGRPGARGTRATIDLMQRREIPNRDLVLSWRVADAAIEESRFAHRDVEGPGGDDGFFTLMLAPPARVTDAQVRARELIFVLDSSGSMEGFPIEKAKEVLARAAGKMRPEDVFNVVTFNETADVLWDAPRRATTANQGVALTHIAARQGGGGTEMKKAVLAALEPTPGADPREAPARFVLFLTDGEIGNDDEVIDAVERCAGRTRMFTVGIGNSPNRALLDAMAETGRGASDYLSLEGDAEAAIERFVRRIEHPVLTDIEIVFDGALGVHDTVPPLDRIPDLFDEAPLVIHGRYATPGRGTLTIRGRAADGPYERVIDLDLPAAAGEHASIATLWARARTDGLVRAGQRDAVVDLGERFHIVTPYTSFVAVERSRMTIEGKSVLVAVPIEMPAGQAWSGTFGPDALEREMDRVENLGMRITTEGLSASGWGWVTAGVSIDGKVASTGYGLWSSDRTFYDGQAEAFVADTVSLDKPRYHEISTRQRDVAAQIAGVQRLVELQQQVTDVERARREREVARNLARVVQPPALELYGEAVASGESLYLYTESASAVALRESSNTTLIQPIEPGQQPAIGRFYAGAPITDLTIDKSTLHIEDRTRQVPLLGDIPVLGDLFETDSLAFHIESEEQTVPRLSRIPSAGAFVVNRLAEGQRSDAAAPLSGEHVVLLVVDLARRGATEQAILVATALVEQRPDFEPGQSLLAALTDEALDDDERAARLDALAEQARRAIADAIEKARRRARLHDVLDERLWSPPAGAPLRVSVLLTDNSAPTITALTAAGLRLEDRAASLPLVVGLVAPTDLEALALLEVVRRIEPARLSADVER